MLFADLEGFTDLMDTEDEQRVSEMLNGYFSLVSTLSAEFGGSANKFMGDGAMVFFGDPQTTDASGDALAAVGMALSLRQCFGQLAAPWRSQVSDRGALRIRIGIHSGYCLVGEFGSSQRKDYTALGSAVNKASRIEAIAAGNEILISDATRRLLGGAVRSRYRGEVALKGFSEKVSVYSVSGIGPDHDSASVSLLSLREDGVGIGH